VVVHDDGTVKYTPTTELASSGGTDSFTVVRSV